MEFFKDDEKVPVFSRDRNIKNLTAYKVLASPPKHFVSSKVPETVSEEISFLFDLTALPHPDDWMTNLVGGFSQNGRSYSKLGNDSKCMYTPCLS